MECVRFAADHYWYQEEFTFAERINDLRLLEQHIKEEVEGGTKSRKQCIKSRKQCIKEAAHQEH
eukprot:14971413-Heterocapsa_arctica.AAC.1